MRRVAAPIIAFFVFALALSPVFSNHAWCRTDPVVDVDGAVLNMRAGGHFTATGDLHWHLYVDDTVSSVQYFDDTDFDGDPDTWKSHPLNANKKTGLGMAKSGGGYWFEWLYVEVDASLSPGEMRGYTFQSGTPSTEDILVEVYQGSTQLVNYTGDVGDWHDDFGPFAY